MNPNGSDMKPVKGFIPIADLRRPNADVILVFLSANGIIFTEQCDDSWYSAHLSGAWIQTGDGVQPSNVSLFLGDDPVRVLGCTSQYQFCNSEVEPESSCTPLNGIFAAQTLAENIWQAGRQKALAEWSANALLHSAIGLPEIISQLGVSSLTSRYKLADGIQGPLPDNQWQLEVQHWFKMTLADLQRVAVETATGPTDASLNQWLQRPQTPDERQLCRNQVSNPAHFISAHLLTLCSLRKSEMTHSPPLAPLD
jgi:hypothetical protein